MAQAAKVRAPMTVEEFLKWDSGDDFVWELIDGYPKLKFAPNPDLLGQAAPSDEHGVVIKNLTFMVEGRIRQARRSCRVIPGAGQKVRRKRERLRIPDLTVKCGRTSLEAQDPILIVEVRSPSDSAREMDDRLADFRALPTVQEILIREQDIAAAILHRRVGDLWQVVEVEGLDGVLTLDSVDLETPLREIYRDVLETETAEV